MEKNDIKRGPDTRKKCPICRKRYEGYGHNGIPVWPGRVCDRCFRDYVLPMRFALMKQEEEESKRGK